MIRFLPIMASALAPGAVADVKPLGGATIRG